MLVFSVYIPASSVVYVQYTPSSKRNLSSKILHKFLPIYFFMLTKLLHNQTFISQIYKNMSILQNKCFAGQHWPSSFRATDFSWWRFFAWSLSWSPAGGRGSCAQVLRNSRLSPASDRLRDIGTPKCRFWRHCACQFGDTISDDNIGAN